jgi:serine/threonine-protein kinase RsbW
MTMPTYYPALLTIAADLKNLATIRAFVEEQMLIIGVEEHQSSHLVLAADELATNIILHGYEKRPGSIEVEVAQQGSDLTITLRDRAPEFDPTGVPEPDINVPLEQRALGGMGVFLARRASDEIRYKMRPGGGNEIALIKRNIFAT